MVLVQEVVAKQLESVEKSVPMAMKFVASLLGHTAASVVGPLLFGLAVQA